MQKPIGRPLQYPVKKLLRLDQETSDALDMAVAELPDATNQSDGIRRILRDWLIGHGYLKT